MNILGLITEYNPFHNGHLYHLEQSKKITGATHSVAIMSGHFLQRGEPALFDKWTRAEMAVRSGVDLVIELPVVYSSQTAEIFAHGSISILNSIGCVDSICFGSESGDIESLKTIASILASEPQKFKGLLHENLALGMSFPSAREKALIDYISNYENEFSNMQSLSSEIKNPNNILGIEYLKSLVKLKSSLVPYTIKRTQAQYNSTQITGNICSATAIREHLKSSYSHDFLKKVVPMCNFNVIDEKVSSGFSPVFDYMFFEMILHSIISKNPHELRDFNEVKEGLQNVLSKCAINCGDYSSLIECLKSKRYTMTGIKRMLSNILLGIKKDDIDYFKSLYSPGYIRILSFNQKGTQIIKKIKESCDIQIINKTANASFDNHMSSRMFEYDIRATNVYNIKYYAKKQLESNGPADYKTSPVFVK